MSVADKTGFGPKREERQVQNGWEISVTPHPMIGKMPTLVVRLTHDQYGRYKDWRSGKGFVQDLLPDLTASTREVLMTGLGDDTFHDMCMEQDEEDAEDD